MKSLLKYLLISLNLLSSGCTAFENTIDEIALECGPDALSKTSHFVKILDSEGNPLSSEAISRLNANYEDSKFALKITSLGCVSVENLDSPISVNAASISQSLATKIDSQLPFQKLRLSSYPEIEAKFDCPEEGIFANKEAQNFLEVQVKNNSETFSLEINAISDFNQETFPLFKKKIGEPLASIPSSFDVSTLPEGKYSLKASFRKINTGWTIAPEILSDNKSCKLSIAHTNDQVTDIREDTFKPGQTISFSESENLLKDYSCFEKFEALDDTPNCESKVCVNEENFTFGRILAPLIPGKYKIFSYTKDQSKNKSAISCKKIVVSNSAPTLDLKWESKYLKKKINYLDFPYSTLTAQMNLSHPFITNSKLDENLECKIEIKVNGLFSLSGDAVDCASGRCAGLPMGDFVPCDKLITLSLRRAWDSPSFTKSVLTLVVKTNDGAGNYANKKLPVIVDESRWSIEELPLPPDNSSQKVHVVEGGYLSYGEDTKKIFLVRNEVFKELPTSFGNVTRANFFLDNTNQVWFIQSEMKDDKSYSTKVFKYENETLVEIASINDVDFLNVVTDGSNGFFIGTSHLNSKYKVIHLKKGSNSLKVIPAKCDLSSNSIIYREESEIYFESCMAKLTLLDTANKFIEFQDIKIEKEDTVRDIILDDRRNLLVYVTNKDGSKDRIVYYNFVERTSKNIAFKEWSQRIPAHWYFFANTQGEILRGVHKWNSSKELWLKDNSNLRIYSQIEPAKAKTVNYLHTFWDQDGTFVFSPDETIYLSRAKNKMRDDSLYQKDSVKREFYFHSNLEGKSNSGYYRLKRNNLVQIENSMLLNNNAFNYFGSYLEDAATIFVSESIYGYYDNLWKEIGSNIDFIQTKMNGLIYFTDSDSKFNFTPNSQKAKILDIGVPIKKMEDDDSTLWVETYKKFGFVDNSSLKSIDMDSIDYWIVLGKSAYIFDKQNGISKISRKNSEMKVEKSSAMELGFEEMPSNCKFQKDSNQSNFAVFICTESSSNNSKKYLGFYTVRYNSDSNEIQNTYFNISELGKFTFPPIVQTDKFGSVYLNSDSGLLVKSDSDWSLLVSRNQIEKASGEVGLNIYYQVQDGGDVWLHVSGLGSKIFLYAPL